MGQPYEAVPGDPEECDVSKGGAATRCGWGRAPSSRKVGPRVVTAVGLVAAVVAVVCLSVSHYESEAARHRSSSASKAVDSRAHGDAVDGSSDGDDVEGALHHASYSFGLDDFMAQRSVKGYLHAEGVDTTDTEALKAYLPAYINVTMRTDLVHGRVGADAMDGYLCFNLYYGDIVSYIVLMSYNGTIHKMFPTFILQDKMHVDALKPRDAQSLLMSGNINMTEEGSVFVWNWVNDSFTKVSGGNYAINSHDIQWSAATKIPSFWAPVHSGMERIHAVTGDVLESISVPNAASDVNHAQLVEGNTVAIMSSRLTDGIIKYDMVKDEVMWICGGEYGQFVLYDIRGVEHAAGSTLWSGQHNAEYFGDNLYFMFDNMYQQDRPSRALIIEIDETAKTAREVWEYVYAEYPGGYSPMFGDNDQLPTGNVLTSWWPHVLTAETGEHDAHVVEITRDKAKAFELSIMGYGATHSARRSSQVGWKMYSVERFYGSPLVYNASCADGELAFVTNNAFKQNDEYSGSFTLKTTQASSDGTTEAGTVVSKGVVTWQPHWLATAVSGSYHAAEYDELELTVTNQFGSSTTKTVTCG